MEDETSSLLKLTRMGVAVGCGVILEPCRPSPPSRPRWLQKKAQVHLVLLVVKMEDAADFGVGFRQFAGTMRSRHDALGLRALEVGT